MNGEQVDDVLRDSELLFADFYADWCGPCQALAPVVERLAKSYAGRVRFVKVNVDHNRRTAVRFGVRSIPTMILFRDGRPIAQLAGYQAEHTLRAMVASHVAQGAPSSTPRLPEWFARLRRRAS